MTLSSTSTKPRDSTLGKIITNISGILCTGKENDYKKHGK